ncbi:hypothetical protein ACQKII_04305 [Lysinibacillus sp. NPDC048646]|uniref:hypothetical protein n=1 Tax=Lysinibacillus sp. NPDC048646 TaxID=3390574 RepID=UPI003CFE254E
MKEVYKNINSKQGIPVRRKNLKEAIRDVKITPFYLAKYTVTKEFYEIIMGKKLAITNDARKPKLNVSWIEAVKFCNLLSDALGYDNYYHYDNDSNEVGCNYWTNGFRLLFVQLRFYLLKF